jgi:hypothetical protein
MREVAWLALIAACGGRPHQPAPVIANHRAAPPEPPYASDAEPEGCAEQVDADRGHESIRLHGRDYTVTLFVCNVSDHADSPEQEKEGFVQHDKVAQLVLAREGAAPKRRTIADWTDGWEWSSSIAIVGVLTAPGGEGALVLRKGSYNTGSGGASISVYTFGPDWAEAIDVGSSEAEGSLTEDHHVAIVELCDITDPTPGAACDSNAKRSTVELRFDGTKVSRTDLPDYETAP